jgi:glyoxylase-like metal-dependent hydrolase (beta-lactamase superfamily II)
MRSEKLQVVPILSMPFAENAYILYRPEAAQAIVVDPGLEPEPILDFLHQHKLYPVAILNTHGHADHIAGNEAMKQAFPAAPLMIGKGDAGMLQDPDLNLSRPFGFDIISPPADQQLDDGEVLNLGGIRLRVRDLPGHSPGHVVFILEQEQPIIVLGGDTLFQESIGRNDFPGGSLGQLLSGIRTILFSLPEDTVVYPGHGDATTVGREKRGNPFLS